VHTFGFAFGNLKPSNILFDESHRIQIVDIVPSQSAPHCRENFDESAQRVNGAPSEFAAPEVLSGHKLTQKADVFAFALILFSIVVGHRPFGEADKRRGRTSSVVYFQDLFQVWFLC
jgi:serine/threonine protein kinase